MINQSKVASYFRLLSKAAGKEPPVIIMKFMCSGIELITPPEKTCEVINTGLAAAKEYWLDGTGSTKELTARRVACWVFLEKKDRGIRINDREDATIRALLCVLHPDEINDQEYMQHSFEWFFEMVNKVGDFNLAFERQIQSMKLTNAGHTPRRPGP